MPLLKRLNPYLSVILLVYFATMAASFMEPPTKLLFCVELVTFFVFANVSFTYAVASCIRWRKKGAAVWVVLSAVIGLVALLASSRISVAIFCALAPLFGIFMGLTNALPFNNQ